jgi:hypothetical protein
VTQTHKTVRRLVPTLLASLVDDFRKVVGLEFVICGAVVMFCVEEEKLTLDYGRKEWGGLQEQIFGRLLSAIEGMELRQLQDIIGRYFWHESLNRKLEKMLECMEIKQLLS